MTTPTPTLPEALRQGHGIASEDGYFEARPQIDSMDRRKVFGAGFERGWEAALAAAPAQERIQALELEVRQLTEQVAALRGGGVEILFEHEDGRYAVNPDTTGDPAWHRLGPVDVSAIRSQQLAPSAAPACTRSHPHENMTWRCQVLSVLAEMHNMEARGQGATEHDLVRFADRLEAALLGSPSAAPAMGSQRFCYSCGHPDDAHPWVENPRGGKRRGNCPENPTPQADSQPAPVLAYPPLPDLDGTLWLAIGQHRRAITNFETTLAVKAVDTAVHGLLRAYVDADRAARAPADSVLEDAARYQWIRGPGEESTRYSRWLIEYWDGPNGWQPMQRERMDSAMDAARKQGANHD